MPLIERKLVNRCQQTKTIFFDAMNQGASSATYRTVTDSNMIEISVDFEPDSTAVTRAFVRLFHDVYLQVQRSL
jgi:hypothetical protein